MPIPSLPATFRFDGARLRAHRERQGRSREEIAVCVRCSVSLITSVELGYTVPSIGKVATLYACYGVRVDDVIVPVDEPETTAE